MPCRVDDDAERIYNAQLQEKKLKDHLNKVTALLCSVTMEFESANPSVFHGLVRKHIVTVFMLL